MAKKSNRFTVCLSDDLLAIETELMRRERYRSHTESYESYLRHWAMSQQPHVLTGDYVALSNGELEELDRGLRQLVESGRGQKGSWLKAHIYECIKELNGLDAKTPTVDQVLRRLPLTAQKTLTKKK